MSDISFIFGGEYCSPPAPDRSAPEQQVVDAMRSAGLDPPDCITMDGKIHRFQSDSKRPEKTGWYCLYRDGIPAGAFGCWRADVDELWRADIGRELSYRESLEHEARMIEAKAARDAELIEERERAARIASSAWEKAKEAVSHPYLSSKGVQGHGARLADDGRLMLPLYDSNGRLSSIQYIDKDGRKLFLSGGAVKGCFTVIGQLEGARTRFVAEGYATAATVHEATGEPCIVAYSASNLPAVAKAMREMLGASADIAIVADNDASGTGQKQGRIAAENAGARLIIPPEVGDVNDYAKSGKDVAALLMPPVSEWLIHADDFSLQPSPIKWAVKRWIQDEALVMIHGPSGGGKTFVVLDWCLRIAAGVVEWCGHKVSPGAVVYLAGEGHHGLRGRIAAWKHYHNSGPLYMWLSPSGCDLNKADGYARVANSIRALPIPPRVIVVDTLHRFLSGDENSSMDAKTMLDACAELMREFRCTVILVHHTGVSEDAQHRARGSSAWKGALDIEISVVPGKKGGPMEIIQRKSKDAELVDSVHLEIVSVAIPGWIDDDGEPVTSAVVVKADAPVAVAKESKLDKHRKMFENAWFASDAEERQGSPYLSRSAFQAFLVSNQGLSESSAKMYVKPSVEGKPIYELLLAGVIQPYEHGWIVISEADASAMMLKRGQR